MASKGSPSLRHWIRVEFDSPLLNNVSYEVLWIGKEKWYLFNYFVTTLSYTHIIFLFSFHFFSFYCFWLINKKVITVVITSGYTNIITHKKKICLGYGISHKTWIVNSFDRLVFDKVDKYFAWLKKNRGSMHLL